MFRPLRQRLVRTHPAPDASRSISCRRRICGSQAGPHLLATPGARPQPNFVYVTVGP